MLPVMLDLTRMRLVLAGNGEAALNRLHRLEAAGAVELAVYSAAPSPELAAAAGARLVRRWPSLAELAQAQMVFIADAPARAALADARAVGALLHVEDEPELSDVQAAAVLHRGALTIAVSTGGASPALAVQLRDFIAGLIGPEWRGRVEDLSRLRRAWRAAGVASSAIAQFTGEWVRGHGWLDQDPPDRPRAN
jgi:precorrin-2 dehydrogenase/sirohydrochlorin ferrochelatase